MANYATFNGRNFKKLVKRLPDEEGIFFIIGIKEGKRIPVSMCKVRCKKFERRKASLRNRFSKPVMFSGEKVERKDYLEGMIKENGFEKILIEWE